MSRGKSSNLAKKRLGKFNPRETTKPSTKLPDPNLLKTVYPYVSSYLYLGLRIQTQFPVELHFKDIPKVGFPEGGAQKIIPGQERT
jgi:hypothetical protein